MTYCSKFQDDRHKTGSSYISGFEAALNEFSVRNCVCRTVFRVAYILLHHCLIQ